MEKLEHYLDQVCRGIAGPRALRQHIRQELREHLTDAVAEHESAGLSKEEALDRALEEFGGSEEVRRELESTHGHRLMTVIVDKAMEWKEKTMKAKWLWTSWAHLALGSIIVLEVLFVVGAIVMVAPKFNQFAQEGWIGPDVPYPNPVEAWAVSFIRGVAEVTNHWAWWVIPPALLWALFEWRARSENKSLIRLAVMGTAAVKLLVIALLVSAAFILPMFIEMPVLYRTTRGRHPEADVRQQLTQLDQAIKAMEQGLAKHDGTATQRPLNEAYSAASELMATGSAAPALVSLPQQQKVDELRLRIIEAQRALSELFRGARLNRPFTDEEIEQVIQKAKALLAEVPAPTTRP